jgi:hypothetical protein
MRARTEQHFRKSSTSRHDVLAVVEDQQKLLRAEIRGQAGRQWTIRFLPQVERGGHGLDDEGGVIDGRELDEPDSVRKGIEQVCGDLHRQPRLAGAAGTREREQVRLFELLLHLRNLAFAAHERRELNGQVVRHILERTERREFGRQILRDELKKVLRPGEIAQSVFAEMPQPYALGQMIAHELLRGM